jgi:tetratricopeptide (TPR) repeat protein
MKNYLMYALLLCTALSTATKAEVFDNGTSKVQLIRVKNLIMGGDYYTAMKVIRDLEKSDSTTAELYFMSGECHFQLKNYEEAIDRLNRSIRLNPNEDPEKYFLLGQTLQATGSLEESIKNYQIFLEKNPKKDDSSEEAAAFILQCKNAIQMMKNPVNVSIFNVSDKINSEYPEYNPSVSADGKKLIFTSRRPESTGKLQDPDDGKFYEDIYIALKDSLSGKWGDPEPVPGRLNTETHDANMNISPDGNQIYVYRNLGYRGSGEILVSKLSRTGKWGEAKPLEGDVNTSYFESSACVSPDGKTLYFVSERPKGGFGMGDIYMCKREGKNSWGKAVNLGPVINDEYDQIGVFVHPDGKTLYYASNSPKALGGYDIFKTTLDNGKWSEPENLGYPINTLGDERFFSMSTDGRTAWFSSNREGGSGDLDIWEIDFSALKKQADENAAQSAVVVPKGPPISIFSGKVIDSNAGEIIETEMLIIDRDSGKQTPISSDENGQYFITLEGNRNYQVKVSNQAYKPYEFDFFLKAQDSGTFTLEKLIVLDKLPK